jgi:hypothetical protein
MYITYYAFRLNVHEHFPQKTQSTETQFLNDLTQGIAADEDVDGARLEPRQHLLPLNLHQAGQLSCAANPSIILIQSINQSIN